MDRRAKAVWGSVMSFAKNRQKTLRFALMSLISLVLVSTLLIGVSFSWFSTKTSELQANQFVLDCGKGLRVNDTGTSNLSFNKNDQTLVPASSVNGRNLFFPTDGSDFSSVTSNMTFRSANAGDKNQNYIQIDFTLTAQQNHTALYINEKETSILVKAGNENNWSQTQAAPLRAALWSSTAEGGVPNTPIVFNPTDNTLYTAAVEDVDRSTGAFISSGRQVAHPFSDYSYGGTPVATLARGVETKFSYIIWLEGTDSKCTDKIKGKNIQINLAFTTSWDKTQAIRFEDKSGTVEVAGNQIGNIRNLYKQGYTLMLHYYEEGKDSDNQTIEKNPSDFVMYDYNGATQGNIWTCNIPGDMQEHIVFVLQKKGADTEYRFSTTTGGASTTNRGVNRLYIADTLDTPHGHWVAIGDSDGAGSDEGGGFEGDDF